MRMLRVCGVVALTAVLARGEAAVAEREAWEGMILTNNWMEAVYSDVALMAEVLMLVKGQYVEEKDARELMYGAIHGMVEGLDPYSAFLEAEDFGALLEEMEGVFNGVGISVVLEEGDVVVVAPMEGGPAERAGILPGDVIVTVDGMPTRGMLMKEALKAFHGPTGTEVRVGVERAEEEPFEVVLTREDIKVKSVKRRMLEEGVGYVRIVQFTAQTGEEFAKAMEELRGKGAEALVVDVRDNPGGVIDAAVNVADWFLAAGADVVSTRGRSAEPTVLKTKGRARRVSWPAVIVVNGASASASEILAGALQDHKRAVVVGEQTFGKASVQQIARLRLRPECGVRLTVARYFTPKGRMIQGEGIAPDVTVQVEPEAWRDVVRQRQRGRDDETRDEALARATEIVRSARILLEGVK